ncbi:MAG: ATP-binding protein [Bacteroidales bacterium]
MNNLQQSIDKLKRENTSLKNRLDKLTTELSKELTDNVEQTEQLRRKNTVLSKTVRRNNNLISQNSLLENRYRIMAENINEPISIVDRNRIFVYANEKMAKLFQKSVSEMINKPLIDILGKDLTDKFDSLIFYPVLESGTMVSGNTTLANGDENYYFNFTGHPILDDNGEIIGFLNVASDITDEVHKQIFSEIEEQIKVQSLMSMDLANILKDIFAKLCRLDYINFGGGYILNEEKQTLDLIFHHNLPDDFVERVKTFNRDSRQFQLVKLGTPRYDYLDEQPAQIKDDFLKMGIKSLAFIPFYHSDKVLGCINVASAMANPFTKSRRVFIENIAWRISSIISMNNAQEKLKTTVDELHETISELRIKQQILIQKSKMESLGELSAGMAHEINQPLVIISLSIENIQQKIQSQPNEISPSYLNTKFESIQLNIKRIQQIIDNMRIFARDQSGILFEKVSIREVICRSLEMLAPRLKPEEIEMVCKNESATIYVLGNIYKLEQVFLNIISNSIYAVNEKMLNLGKDNYKKRIEINVSSDENQVIIEITDNGIGIREENLDKLFTPFFTTKMEGHGTGLGLPIVYGIIKEMNGEIRVKSSVNEFTSVLLVIPVV